MDFVRVPDSESDLLGDVVVDATLFLEFFGCNASEEPVLERQVEE